MNEEPPAAATPEPNDLDFWRPLIAARDADAFARWLADAEPALRSALRPFAAQADVEAVLQETLLRVWIAAPGFEPDGRPNGLLRFAFRIAKNLAVSEARRLRPEAIADVDLDRLAEPDRVSEPDPLLRKAILECRAALPPQPSRALQERLENGATEPDVALAERLGMRLNTFLQNVTRARKLIADCLRRRGVVLEAMP